MVGLGAFRLPRRGMGDTTVTVGSQTITVDAEGNWVAPWYCAYGGALFGGDCTPPSGPTLLAANNAANIGASASPAAAAAATAAMSRTDQGAMSQDPCYASSDPAWCAATGGLVGSNPIAQTIPDWVWLVVGTALLVVLVKK